MDERGRVAPSYGGRIVAVALEPCVSVTTTWTWQMSLVLVSPAGRPPWQEVDTLENAGGVTVSSNGLSTLTTDASTPPKETVGVPEKPDPKIEIGFGVVSDPPYGLTPVTDG